MDKEFKFSATEFAHMMRISPSALRKRRLTGKLDGQFKKVDNTFSAIETRYGSGYRWNVN